MQVVNCKYSYPPFLIPSTKHLKMKKYTFLFCCLALLMMSACKDDEDTTNRLNYDTENVTGPLLEPATWQAGARFTPAETAEFTGLRLTQVEYFMGGVPAGTDIRIFGPGVNNNPGDLLYSAQVGDAVQPGRWNRHRLATPIDITGQELWIAVGLVHQVDQQSIGCDAGPADTDGDWLFSSIDGQWIKYFDRTQESINWNIRGVVEE